MNYDIYHSSITYFPLLPLSKTVSFERKVLDIRQMPAQVWSFVSGRRLFWFLLGKVSF